MAQRQFRSDDTSKWKEAFGTGSDGDLSYGGGGFGGQVGFGLATFTGTAGNTYGVFSDVVYFNGSNGGRVGDIVLIHQSYGSGAGNWELNKIVSRVGSTLNLKYPLMNTYSAGCQVQSCGMFKNLTLSGTTTPYTSWGGTVGGIIFLIAKDTLTISGAVSANGAGYRGGPKDGGAGMVGYCGEDIDSGWVRQTGANGISGGGGNENGASDAKPGGGGGGHATGGSNGASNEAPGIFGTGGGTIGVAGLTTIYFGGAGGQGAYWYTTGSAMNPGEGGGIVLLIAKNIVISGSINTGGSAGSASAGAGGASGGGAGGSVLFKCETATLGSNLTTSLGGAGGTGDSNNGAGGAGGVGRVHIDYSKSYTGTSNPTIDARQDLTVKAMGGSDFFNFF